MNSLTSQIKPHLTGIIRLIEGARYGPNIPCGWRSVLDDFKNPNHSKTSSDDVGKSIVYCPLLVPESEAFQHFLDGTIPKLLQVLPFLLLENVQLVIFSYNGRNRVIPAILNRLGLDNLSVKQISIKDRIENRVTDVEYELNTCVAPPLHPLLIQTLHTLIGAPWDLEGPINNTFVILLNRRHSARNPGRVILNHDHVASFLKQRYGDRFHSFHGVYDLQRAFSVFGKARMIIGVHGGAFYNLNFSPRQTTIVEVMPVWGDEYPNLAHSIVWRMADALGQPYWRINQQAEDSFCNVKVNIHKLEKVLDIVDQAKLPLMPENM